MSKMLSNRRRRRRKFLAQIDHFWENPPLFRNILKQGGGVSQEIDLMGKLKKWTIPRFQLVADALTRPLKKCVPGSCRQKQKWSKIRSTSDVFQTTVSNCSPHKIPFGQLYSWRGFANAFHNLESAANQGQRRTRGRTSRRRSRGSRRRSRTWSRRSQDATRPRAGQSASESTHESRNYTTMSWTFVFSTDQYGSARHQMSLEQEFPLVFKRVLKSRFLTKLT